MDVPSQPLAACRQSWSLMLKGTHAQLRKLPARIPSPPNICPWIYEGFAEFSDYWNIEIARKTEEALFALPLTLRLYLISLLRVQQSQHFSYLQIDKGLT